MGSGRPRSAASRGQDAAEDLVRVPALGLTSTAPRGPRSGGEASGTHRDPLTVGPESMAYVCFPSSGVRFPAPDPSLTPRVSSRSIARFAGEQDDGARRRASAQFESPPRDLRGRGPTPDGNTYDAEHRLETARGSAIDWSVTGRPKGRKAFPSATSPSDRNIADRARGSRAMSRFVERPAPGRRGGETSGGLKRSLAWVLERPLPLRCHYAPKS
jgi:hypothetical protein